MSAIECAMVGCQRLAIVKCEQCKRYFCRTHIHVLRFLRRETDARAVVQVYCDNCHEALNGGAGNSESRDLDGLVE